MAIGDRLYDGCMIAFARIWFVLYGGYVYDAGMNIGIIGGWAAGLMAAASILEDASFQGQVFLRDKNPWLWAKVIISGWGRCNVTTGHHRLRDVLAKYPRGSDFLSSCLKQFTPRGIYQRFESHGVPLKIEEDMRVFPVSNDGKDIVGVFEELFAQDRRITVCLREWVESVSRRTCSDGSCSGFVVTTAKQTVTVDRLVVTTGGNAYTHTGSSGDGYAFARACGHTITPLGPSLNSFLVAQDRVKQLSWLSLVNAQLISQNNKNLTASWPVLLTHFGVSWPAVFAFSSLVPLEQIDQEHPYQIRLVPLAGKSYDRWTAWLTDGVRDHPKKTLKNSLHELLVERLCVAICEQVQIDPLLPIWQLTRDHKKNLVNKLSGGFWLDLIARRPGDEFVTAGGVSLDEVNPHTCESKLCPWLYFAGEVLDIDGYTWWYNLTSSWATGRCVGKNVG